jgi:hypothetical protein
MAFFELASESPRLEQFALSTAAHEDSTST